MAKNLNLIKRGVSKKRKPKKLTEKQIQRRKNPAYRRFVITSLIFVAVCIVSVTVVGVYMLTNIVSTVSGDLVLDLDEYVANQDRTSFVYGYDGDQLVELFRMHGAENRVWIDIEEMPDDLINAYVALEDKRFWDHHGVDWVRTVGVVVEYHFKQGGSTITQQLIKNLTGEDGRTFNRKYKEILTALNLEKHFTKNEILEAYLNTLYLDQGCNGVETASEKYFGKKAKNLNAAECACLAAITKAPFTYDPLINPDKNRERQLTCLKNMKDQGYLDDKEYEAAVDYKMVFTNSKGYVPSDDLKDDDDDAVIVNKSEISDYYVDYVIESVIQDLAVKLDITESDAERKVFYGGLKIYSAVNVDVQKIVNSVYTNRTAFSNSKAQSAITIMDYKGRVIAMAGGAGKKTTVRGLNRAVDSPRQPGSSIKPLSVYAPAIEEGVVNYSTMMQNYALTINGKRWPQNYGGSYGSANSFVTVQYAVAESINTVSARVCKKLGSQTCFDYLKDNFHMSTLVEGGEKTDVNMSSMAVGGMTKGVTTLDMAAAFATFGNGGMYYEPYSYTKVTNSDGSKVLLENETKSERAVSEGTAGVMRKLLDTVVKSGTGSRYGVHGFETYGKTGTTSDNYDRWFVGGTPYYVAAVWYGYDTNKSISADGNPAGKIFSNIMNKVHKNLKDKSFDDSDDVVTRKYCKFSGKLAGDQCAETAYGYYRKSFLPSRCDKCDTSTTSELSTEKNTTSTTKNITPHTGTTVPQTTQQTTGTITKPPVTEPADVTVIAPPG